MSMNSLEFAIQMELDGEKFYTEQAQINKNNNLNAICLMLAEDEKNHATILRNKQAEIKLELVDTETLSRAKSIFQGIGDFKSEVKAMPSQLDFYRMALDMEKKSIELYAEFLDNAADDKEKEMFEYLIGQEEGHYEIIDELVQMLRSTDEWVESAEFGIRKGY
jgi:rubrerythrin